MQVGGETNAHTNGHTVPQNEARSIVLELNAKRSRIESEIKEYQDILRSVRELFGNVTFYPYGEFIYLGRCWHG